MEKYKTFSEKLSGEEFSREFSNEFSEELEKFSKEYFDDVGKYPSEKLLKGIEMHYLGQKMIGDISKNRKS